jgi:hypothetical protein
MGSAVVTVDTAPTADAGDDQSVCPSDPEVTLDGTIGGSATSGMWSTSGTGMFANASMVDTTYTPSAQDISNGSVMLTLTTNDPAGPCMADSDSMTVTFNAEPNADAGLDQTLCEDADGTTSFFLNGTATGGTPSWSQTGSTGSANAMIVSPNSEDTSVNVTGIGTVTLELKVTSNTMPSCGEDTDSVVLTVNNCELPVAQAPVMDTKVLLIVALGVFAIGAARVWRRQRRRMEG